MMDGPYGLSMVQFGIHIHHTPLLPFYIVERFRDVSKTFVYVVDQLDDTGIQNIYANAFCDIKNEEEVEAAKQWLLDMAMLRYGS